MKTFKKNSIEVQEFEGVNEFARFCEGDMNKAFKKHYNNNRCLACSHEQYESYTKFSGTASYEEANNLMVDGYQDGLKNLKETKTKLTERATQQRPQIKLDVVGFAPCVPNAIIGLPKSMIKREKSIQKTPIVNIFYNVFLSGTNDKKVLFEGGKNLLAAIKTLEAQGLRVNLKIGVVTFSSLKDDAPKMCSVVIKKASQTLNPLLVSYPLTHPSFFRRHIFAWMETSTLTSASGFVNGYGYIFEVHPKVRELGERNFLKREGILSENEYYIKVTEAANAESLDDLFRTMGLLKK